MKRFRRFLERLPKIGNFFYWLRTHLWNRYHIINIKNPDQGYSWGWIDRDHALLLANFAILVDFIEKEVHKDYGLIDTAEQFWTNHEWQESEKEMIQKQVDAERKIRALYTWWKVQRKIDHDKFDKMETKNNNGEYTPELMDEYIAQKNELRFIDQSKLHELINLRYHLWT